MAWCGLVLKEAANNIVNKNKFLKDLENKNKALQAQVDDLNNAYASVLSNLSKALEEKKNWDATLSNQEAFIHTQTASLALAKEEIKKKDEEIVALPKTCIDKSTKGANHMKTILFFKILNKANIGLECGSISDQIGRRLGVNE